VKLDDDTVELVGADGKTLTLMPVLNHRGEERISLIREGGEGGDFSEHELVEAIRWFMSERM
jgi:hypothetical protein